jgi:hypothetical protein
MWGYILCDSTYVKSKIGKSMETEGRAMVVRSWGDVGRNEKELFLGYVIGFLRG